MVQENQLSIRCMKNLKDMPRINVDEIVRDIGNWKNPMDVFAAGKIAVKNINRYLEEGITLCRS